MFSSTLLIGLGAGTVWTIACIWYGIELGRSGERGNVWKETGKEAAMVRTRLFTGREAL